MLKITVQCNNCHNIFEAEQYWNAICPKCGSSNTGLMSCGHTIASEPYNWFSEWSKNNVNYCSKFNENQNIAVNFNFFEKK